MHGFVLENGVGRLGPLQQRVSWPLDVGVTQCVDDLPIGFIGKLLHFVTRRPSAARPR